MSEVIRSSLLRASDVASRLGASEQRVHELARLGLLPCVRMGRSVRFDPAVVELWIQTGGKAFEGGWRRDSADV